MLQKFYSQCFINILKPKQWGKPHYFLHFSDFGHTYLTFENGIIIVDENDVLWIGTRSGYIVRVDESGQAFFSTLVYPMHTSQIGNINGHSGTGTTAVLNGDGIWRLIKMA